MLEGGRGVEEEVKNLGLMKLRWVPLVEINGTIFEHEERR